MDKESPGGLDLRLFHLPAIISALGTICFDVDRKLCANPDAQIVHTKVEFPPIVQPLLHP